MQTEPEQQYNGQRERITHQCHSWQQARSTTVPHRHQCSKLLGHKLAHECNTMCGYRWNTVGQSDPVKA